MAIYLAIFFTSATLDSVYLSRFMESVAWRSESRSSEPEPLVLNRLIGRFMLQPKIVLSNPCLSIYVEMWVFCFVNCAPRRDQYVIDC